MLSIVFITNKRIQGTGSETWYFIDWLIANVLFGKRKPRAAKARVREMRQEAGELCVWSDACPAGHDLTASLCIAAWAHDGLMRRNRHLGKAHWRQEWRDDPRSDADQSSPQRRDNSQHVILVIGLIAMLFIVYCELTSSRARWINWEGITCSTGNVRRRGEPTWFSGLPHSGLSLITKARRPSYLWLFSLGQT